MLSNTCKYAIRAVIFISLHSKEKFVGIKKISDELKIPSPFLGKILQTLAKQKLLVSSKGPHGGFNIAKPANEISLAEIVNLIDGDDLFNNCLISFRRCKEEKEYCAMHSRYQDIRDDIERLFNNTSIADLQENIENSLDKIIL